MNTRDSHAIHEAVQELLRELRTASGFRQSDLAHKLGVPQSFVSKYEAGERRLDIVEIRSLCKTFGISLAEFAQRLEQRLKGAEQ